MSDISKEKIEHLASLSRIKLTSNEVEDLTSDLKKLVDYVEQLEQVDVSNLQATSHVEEQGIGSLREDKPEGVLSKEDYLKNAPDHMGGMIKIPTVMKP